MLKHDNSASVTPDTVLPDHFFTMPRTAHPTMTTPELRSVLMRHDGQVCACGELWTIRNKHIGAGVHRVYLLPACDENGNPQ